MAAANARRRDDDMRLIDGRTMRCPRCLKQHDVLQYVRLSQPEEFMEETAPVYKCPRQRGGCGFIFAPADDPLAAAAVMLGGSSA